MLRSSNPNEKMKGEETRENNEGLIPENESVELEETFPDWVEVKSEELESCELKSWEDLTEWVALTKKYKKEEFIVKDEGFIKEWEIKQGPRNKSLATQHLEYIVYALLSPETETTFSYRRLTGTIITINNAELGIKDRKFHLKQIWQANPDFEQFYFTDDQLNLFLEKYKEVSFTPVADVLRLFGENMDLHPAEKLAIEIWTGTHESASIQKFLRKGIAAEYALPTLLATICIASHAIAKPLKSSSYSKTKTVRTEVPIDEVIQQRSERSTNKKVVTEKGFSAASCTSFTLFAFNPSRIRIRQPKAINPIGKDITLYSRYARERETVFPPGTKFAYLPGEGFIFKYWDAIPVRPADSEDSTNYAENFSDKEIDKINREKNKLLIKSIDIGLAEKAKNNKGGLIRQQFYGESYKLALTCYDKARNVIKKLLEECDSPCFSKAESFQQAKKDIQNIIDSEALAYMSKKISSETSCDLKNAKNALKQMMRCIQEPAQELIQDSSIQNAY